MKFKNAMQLKALLNNLATRQKLSPQLVLQNYYIERFLERLSMSEYRPNLILKGGVLMSNLVGLNFRTTMDIDTTIVGIPMKHESVRDVFQKICDMQVDDDVAFEVTGVTNIADHNDYPGLRVSLLATQMPMKTKIEIDITTGDRITPDVVERELKLMFDAGVCKVFSYPIETLLAEKLETILSLELLNTRPRDFYDVYLLFRLKEDEIRIDLLKAALKGTCEKRNTSSKIAGFENMLSLLREDEGMNFRWKVFQKKFSYAKEIAFEETIETVREIFRKVQE